MSSITTAATTGFADEGAVSWNDGFVLRGRYAVVRRFGIDSPTFSIEYTPQIETRGVFDYERFSTIGLMTIGFASDEDAADDTRYVDVEEVAPKIYTLQLNRSYDRDDSYLGLTMTIPDLTPIIPRYERNSDVGDGKGWQFSETWVDAPDRSFADYEDGGGRLLADSIYLLDPDVVEPMMQGVSFADVSRVGIPAYYAELQIDLHGIETPRSSFCENLFAEFDMFTVPEDTERIDRAFRAVLEAKALRDTIAVSFSPIRPVAMGDYIKTTTVYSDWVRDAL